MTATVDGGEELAPGVGSGGDGATMTSLRGARVEVDAKVVGRVLGGLCLLGLLAAVVALFVAGASRNAQIAELRQRGVPVRITVTSCIGLLGGSGSNGAGYACTGAYTVGGQRYQEHLPGNALRAPGSTLAGIASPTDPRLVTTATELAGEQPSGTVFLLPLALLVVLLLALAGLWWRRPSRRRSARPVLAGGPGAGG